MLTFMNCPFEYRNGVKVYLIPANCSDKEWRDVWQGWYDNHFLNFEDPAIFDFIGEIKDAA